ncbi:MAG: vitamin K epoxide reductase family protein [Parcubacteria group bacterium]|nr:vitamin K epoxide reductase family protein [Parcubacteria group bacterium]
MMQKKLLLTTIIIGLVGFADAFYLTVKHYSQSSIFCSVLNNGCDLVTSSRYSAFGGVPIALIGTIYYAFIVLLAALLFRQPSSQTVKLLLLVSSLGFLFSLWLLYLQIFVIKALCFYCIISAATSTLIFIISLIYSLKNNKNEHQTY